MQIHELNSFSGTPGNNNYLAIDDGSDTGKISGTELLAPVNTRIDNIISGVTVDSEVIDGRIGADGVTYGSLGTAIRTQVSDLKADNFVNIIRGMQIAAGESNGITFANNADGSISVSGTATATSFKRMFNSTNSFPAGISKGKKYLVKYSVSDAVDFQIYGYFGGSPTELVNTRSDIIFEIPSSCEGLMIRMNVSKNNTVNVTVSPAIYALDSFQLLDYSEINYGSAYPSGATSCNNITENSIYYVGYTSGTPSLSEWAFSNAGWLETKVVGGDSSSNVFQVAYPLSPAGFITPKYRVKQSGNWTAWREYTQKNIGGYYPDGATSCDDVIANGIYFIGYADGQTSLSDYAYNSAGWLIVEAIGTNTNAGVVQIALPFNAGDYSPNYRVRKSGTWTEWESFGETKIISQDVYNNTYNITTSPQITTDSNGWLQAVDTDTSDETNKTDMTGAIMSMLNSTGYCHLSEGIFYVSGNIDMPYNSTLEGCGKGTIIRLLNSVNSGYCVKVTRGNTVKGIRFSGGYSEQDVSTSSIGGRNGIHYIANADGEESTQPSILTNMVDNCWFENFSGSGIYCHNTGGGLNQMLVSDCHITLCKAGINIDYYSEYSKFTNVIIYKCYYACINNGGNNVFIGCTFHGTIGFLIDNSGDDMPNIGHGSAVGCTFNHIDNWNRPDTLGGGDAIKIIDSAIGFVFTGCQVWYGVIDIHNSRGVVVSDTLIGGNPTIKVSGSYPAFFASCIFHSTPTLSVNGSTKFDNCYLDSTGAAVTN